MDGAILTNDDFAAKKNYFGEEMSTSGSSTCYIYAPDFYAENITFENSAGRGCIGRHGSQIDKERKLYEIV